jgi:hypothetical protein
MKFSNLSINGLKLIQKNRINDKRGFFSREFCKTLLKENDINYKFRFLKQIDFFKKYNPDILGSDIDEIIKNILKNEELFEFMIEELTKRNDKINIKDVISMDDLATHKQ